MDTKHTTDHTDENPEVTEQQSHVTASEDFSQYPIPPRPVDEKRGEEDDCEGAVASTPAITARVDTNDRE